MKPKDYPRPNIGELPSLYAGLDNLVQRVDAAIRNLPEHLFDKEKEIIHFGRMNEGEFRKLVASDPEAMVIAFTRVCGLSIREFSRLFELKDVYRLQSKWAGRKDENLFVKSIMGILPKQMHLETFLYTFYKMWEEHQKRHRRGREFEEEVRDFFRARGYECEKITSPIEVNGAIPSINPRAVFQVRTGVMRDLVKRAKEFGSEFRLSAKAFPGAKFIAVFKIPPHELNRRTEIRQKILEHRVGREYDVIFQDELEEVLKKFKEWNIPKGKPKPLVLLGVERKSVS